MVEVAVMASHVFLFGGPFCSFRSHLGSCCSDIYGGHSKADGEDNGDHLSGGDGDDVILGDNGAIIREAESVQDFPWYTYVWKHYPEPFQSEAIRDIRRYDDLDHVQGKLLFSLEIRFLN